MCLTFYLMGFLLFIFYFTFHLFYLIIFNFQSFNFIGIWIIFNSILIHFLAYLTLSISVWICIEPSTIESLLLKGKKK